MYPSTQIAPAMSAKFHSVRFSRFAGAIPYKTRSVARCVIIINGKLKENQVHEQPAQVCIIKFVRPPLAYLNPPGR